MLLLIHNAAPCAASLADAPRRSVVAMPFIESGGIKLYFEEHGQGYPIIFVHEFESDLESWEAQIRHFSRSYRCIAFNARGYPPSDVPDDPAAYGWEFAVQDIDAVVRGLSIGRAHVVGSSMGAYAALLFGLRCGEKVSTIVSAGAGLGSPASDRESWSKNASVLARALSVRGIDAMAGKMAGHSTRIRLKHKDPKGWVEFVERLKQHSTRGMSNTLLQCQAVRPSLYDFQDQFSRMKVPVLLAVGDEDKPCLETALMLKSTIAAAGIWVCPNTGHAVNLEEPAAFNAQVERFLDAVDRGGWSHLDRQKQSASSHEKSTAALLHFDGALP
ncbi:alpha/beta fold hydrolase [Bradyrhizobium sp. TZ2]